MFRNKLILSAALSVASLVGSQVLLTPVASASMTHASSPKMVKLSIANSGTETLNLMVGTQAMTVEAGKTIAVAALPGTNITVVNDTRTHKAGDVLTQITKDLGGATIRVS